MDIKLQHILFHLRVKLHCSIQDLLSHLLHPIHVALFEISQTPKISSLDQRQQMKTRESFLVPIQIRREKKSFLSRGALAWVSEQNVFLLFPTFDDVEDPIQASFVPHPLHVGSYMLLVDRWCLSDHPNGLWGVFRNVPIGAGIDEIDF